MVLDTPTAPNRSARIQQFVAPFDLAVGGASGNFAPGDTGTLTFDYGSTLRCRTTTPV